MFQKKLKSSYDIGTFVEVFRMVIFALIYRSTFARVYLLSMNLETCPLQWNFWIRYSTSTSFTQPRFRITSFQMWLLNNIPNVILSIACCIVTYHSFSFFLVAQFFNLYITLPTKQCYWRDWHVGSWRNLYRCERLPSQSLKIPLRILLRITQLAERRNSLIIQLWPQSKWFWTLVVLLR